MPAGGRRSDLTSTLRATGQALILVAGAFLIGVVFAQAVVSILLSVGFTQQNDFLVLLVSSSIGQFIGFYIAVWWYFERVADFADLVHAHFPSFRDLWWAVGGLVILFLTNFILGELLVQFGLEGAQNAVIEQGRQQPVLFVYLIPMTILFVAPAEELLFRGAVQGLLRRSLGTVPGIVIASAIFGVAHYLALGGTGSRAATIAVIVVLGLVLGTVYERSENIVVPITVHAGWNVAIFAWEYGAVTGLV